MLWSNRLALVSIYEIEVTLFYQQIPNANPNPNSNPNPNINPNPKKKKIKSER